MFISTHTLSHCRYLQLLFAHSAPLPCPVFSVCALLLCKSAAITLSNTLKLSHTHTHSEASANNAISHKSAYLIYKFSSAKFPDSQEHTHCPGTIVGCRNGDSGPVDHHTRGWCNCEQTKENKHIIIIIPRGRPGNYLCIMARCTCFCTCVCVREKEALPVGVLKAKRIVKHLWESTSGWTTRRPAAGWSDNPTSVQRTSTYAKVLLVLASTLTLELVLTVQIHIVFN